MLKIFISEVPSNLFTKAKLRKMGFKPASNYEAFVIFPPSRRRYKLYSIERAQPIDRSVGFSVLKIDNSIEAKQKFEEIRKRFMGGQ
ncbi:hypothetical protein PAECIP111893_01280 [Paenibacillus plantiphilus]|uniref:Uncharacterized protein n=1 Tax=Paenibacillus plantiphilus TaxID=2905650 RepID=A0ABN8G6H4_9BACL|nr:hypothetical protein PAECIP111893_01280 [Paenibacillus plantiphilus]